MRALWAWLTLVLALACTSRPAEGIRQEPLVTALCGDGGSGGDGDSGSGGADGGDGGEAGAAGDGGAGGACAAGAGGCAGEAGSAGAAGDAGTSGSAGASGASGSAGWSVCPVAGPCVALAVGDSLTKGSGFLGAYRPALYRKAIDADRWLKFVGTQTHGNTELLALREASHEGYGGFTIPGVKDTLVVRFADPILPATVHLVLIHLGTNHVSQNLNLPPIQADGGSGGVRTAGDDLDDLLTLVWGKYPAAMVLAACPLLPMRPNATYDPRMVLANYWLCRSIDAQVSAGKHIVRVPMDDVLDRTNPADYAPSDTIHPNEAGYGKVAARWWTYVSPWLH
jgi:lysophospholipase L1-like esterase